MERTREGIYEIIYKYIGDMSMGQKPRQRL